MNNSEVSVGPKLVVIGGGTGSFTLLSSLKHYVKDITAIVNMVDDGGSTGELRDELGVLPAGDIRQCLVALSDSSKDMRDLFNFRFPEGKMKGHSFGNLFLTAIEKMTDNFEDSVRMASRVLNVQGRVLPVTLEKVNLVLKEAGRQIIGEHKITEHNFTKEQPPQLLIEPAASLNPKAKQAIEEADVICIAPGNLYSSLIPTVLVEGMPQALQDSEAKVVQVVNLVTKPGQTDGFSVADFVNEFERFAGNDVVDYVLYNTNLPSAELRRKYAKDGEYPVQFKKDQFEGQSVKLVGKDFLSGNIYQQDKNDTMIDRTLIRHNADKVARELMKIYYS